MPRAYRLIVATASPIYSSLPSFLSFFFLFFFLYLNATADPTADDRHDQSFSERFLALGFDIIPVRPTRFSKNIHKLRTKSTWNSQNHNIYPAPGSSSSDLLHRRRFLFFDKSTRVHGSKWADDPKPPNTTERFVGAIVRAKHSLAIPPCVVATLRQTVTYRLTLNYHQRYFLPPYFLRHRFKLVLRYARFVIRDSRFVIRSGNSSVRRCEPCHTIRDS